LGDTVDVSPYRAMDVSKVAYIWKFWIWNGRGLERNASPYCIKLVSRVFRMHISYNRRNSLHRPVFRVQEKIGTICAFSNRDDGGQYRMFVVGIDSYFCGWHIGHMPTSNVIGRNR
jgi:hypothetical protein